MSQDWTQAQYRSTSHCRPLPVSAAIVKWAQVFPVVFRESVTTHIFLLPISYPSSVYVFQLTKQQLHAAGLDSHVSRPLFTLSRKEKMSLLIKGGFPLFSTQWLFITQDLWTYTYYRCRTDADDKNFSRSNWLHKNTLTLHCSARLCYVALVVQV